MPAPNGFVTETGTVEKAGDRKGIELRDNDAVVVSLFRERTLRPSTLHAPAACCLPASWSCGPCMEIDDGGPDRGE